MKLGEAEIAALVERLRKEKAESVAFDMNLGREDGYQDASLMAYDEFAYASTRFLVGADMKALGDWQIFQDGILGECFTATRDKAEDEKDSARVRIFADIAADGSLGASFIAYLQGWLGSIHEVWSAVKDDI